MNDINTRMRHFQIQKGDYVIAGVSSLNHEVSITELGNTQVDGKR